MEELSPIILFVYNRPDHTSRTINALRNNLLASQSELYIYSDAPKNSTVEKGVEEVRKLISDISGFKKVTVYEQKINIGLAKSIISGVTEISRKYGKVIVLEDDLVTSKYFLQFMNNCLNIYQGDENVISVSGCTYPIETNEIESETYFLRIPLCWGWATWESKWKLFEKKLSSVSRTPKSEIKYVNFDSSFNYFKQAELNVTGNLNTWFIFWYLTAAKFKKLSIFPTKTLVINIGHDGTGENCSVSDVFSQKLSEYPVKVEKQKVEENVIALINHKKYFKKIRTPFFKKVLNKLLRILKNDK